MSVQTTIALIIVYHEFMTSFSDFPNDQGVFHMVPGKFHMVPGNFQEIYFRKFLNVWPGKKKSDSQSPIFI